MNKELKEELISFVHAVIASGNYEEWCDDLLVKLQRKRGRQKGKKYPKKQEGILYSSSIEHYIEGPVGGSDLGNDSTLSNQTSDSASTSADLFSPQSGE